jgi:hypothetical protein
MRPGSHGLGHHPHGGTHHERASLTGAIFVILIVLAGVILFSKACSRDNTPPMQLDDRHSAGQK